MQIITRDQAGLSPPDGITALDPRQLLGVVVHWFGIPNSVSDHANCAALWRNVQQAHLNHPTENYADIAYNHGVCRHGYVFEGRGFGVRSGANGTTFANSNYSSAVYMAGTGDGAGVYTQDGRTALAEIIREWQREGAGNEVLPHKFFTGSDCPGPTLLPWVANRGHITDLPKEAPVAPCPVVEPWVPFWLAWYLGGRIEANRPKNAPTKIPQVVWDLVRVVTDDRKLRAGASTAEVAALKEKIAKASAILQS